MVNPKRVIDQFLSLVQIDSVSTNERAIADYLKQVLLGIGLDVYEDNAGDSFGNSTGNLIGKLKGDPNYPPILLMAHMDTVSPGRNIKPVLKDGVLYSDGTTILGADNAAGLVSILEALQVVNETGITHGNIEILFTVSEEIGLKGAKGLDVSKLSSRLGFCLDGGGVLGTIINEAPAHNLFTFVFKGKAAHAGAEPEKGISAIQAAAYAISSMSLGRIDEETTANIGIIQGGEGFNIIPSTVKVIGEARSLNTEKLNNQTDHMITAAKAAADRYGANVECIVDNSYSAFRVDEKSPAVGIAVKAAQRIGVNPVIQSTGGGADANILNSKGISTLVFGIGVNNAHTLQENIAVKDLIRVSEYTVSIIESSTEVNNL